MIDIVFGLVGGIGLFLLGMVLLTDGVKSFAGDSLRKALLKFTGKPIKAFVSGVLATALVQSSSATTVTMIGFVSAGLLTFPQALGVVLGASLGTTSTGWLVALLGLKVSVGYYALPLVGVGAFLKLLAPRRWKSFGIALAGFGLIFVGIENLQLAMKDVSGAFDFTALPAAGLGGRLLVVMVGMGMTVVMQSSSAAVATTLTALHAGSIRFDQAMLVVIGAAIGTTVTGALASIGASVPAKRTALGLVLFTLATGTVTFTMLPIFLAAIEWAQANLGLEPGAVSLAAFHTSFIAMGVALHLPFTRRFAMRVERLLPDKGPELAATLDNTMLTLPVVALEAVRRTMREIAAELFSLLKLGISSPYDDVSREGRAARIEQALRTTEDFFTRVPAQAEEHDVAALRGSILHAFDHLIRLAAYTRPPANVRRLITHEWLAPHAERARAALERARTGLQANGPNGWLHQVERDARHLAEASRVERPRLLQQTASGAWEPLEALDALDALRWLATVTYHLWRICHYLGNYEDAQSVAEHETWKP